MATSVQMPALGESVTEGTVTRWLKQVGDRVEVDEPLLEVSTDKVDTEIPSPAAGVLQKIVAQEDETVAVGSELAVIGDSAGGGGDAPSTDQQEPAKQPEPAAEEPKHAAPEPESESAGPQLHPDSPQAATGGPGTPVVMPALGESVTEGTVTRWLKQVGDSVEVDEALVEVSTDKVDTEIPSPVAGTLLQITAGEDQTVEVGGQLAVIGASGGAAQQAPAPSRPDSPPAQQAAPPAPEPAPQPSAPEQKSAPEPVAAQPAASGNSSGSPYVTPLVRKLAAENGIDLGSLKGTGIGGRIRKQDVLAAADEAKASAAAPCVPTQPLVIHPDHGHLWSGGPLAALRLISWQGRPRHETKSPVELPVTVDDANGHDLLSDLPQSFDPLTRAFATRRVSHTWVRPPSDTNDQVDDQHDPFALLGW